MRVIPAVGTPAFLDACSTQLFALDDFRGRPEHRGERLRAVTAGDLPD